MQLFALLKKHGVVVRIMSRVIKNVKGVIIHLELRLWWHIFQLIPAIDGTYTNPYIAVLSYIVTIDCCVIIV